MHRRTQTSLVCCLFGTLTSWLLDHLWIPVTTGPVVLTFGDFFVVRLNKLLNGNRVSGALRWNGAHETSWWWRQAIINSLRPRQNGRHFPDDIFKCISLNWNVWISPKISLKFVPKVPINNLLVLVQIMDWRRSGDKPLSEPMLVSLLTQTWVTRSQWINSQ